MGRQYQILCSKNGNDYFIISIRRPTFEWFYFDEEYVSIERHPSFLIGKIQNQFDKDGSVTARVNFSSEEEEFYFDMVRCTFRFDGQDLKTLNQMQKHIDDLLSEPKKKSISVRKLLFSEETNPLIFLNKFESAVENLTDEDKKFNLLEFIDEEDERLFTDEYLNGNWMAMRKRFLDLYSTKFNRLRNEKLNKGFDSFSSLYEFFKYYLDWYPKLTSIDTLQQQIELILLKIPIELSDLFIAKEKIFKSKQVILDFCKLIDAQANSQITSSDDDTQIDNDATNDCDSAIVESNSISTSVIGESIINPSRNSNALNVPLITVTHPETYIGTNFETSVASDDHQQRPMRKRGRPKKRPTNLTVVSEYEESNFENESSNHSSELFSLGRYNLRKRITDSSESSN